ncbi:MAG: sigma-70 family RNA polymerase sigma factor [Anaerolineales bacterium]|nr:sigma-70 family RNA polymerase sigma factor [Anaerolineales bacterium]
MSKNNKGFSISNFDIETTALTSLTSLLETGQERGYISYTEIIQIFPDVQHDNGFLGDLITEIQSAGIQYIDDDNIDSDDESGAPNLIYSDPLDSDEDYLKNIDATDAIGLYLREATRVPLLTKEEEIELAQRIECGRLAREKLSKNNINDSGRQDLQQMIEDEWVAREHLITANSRLVISVAKRYIGRGVPFLDLIQEGNIGLMRAAKKFDYRRGYKFSTYATWWIRQAVTRAIADHGRTIRVPVHMGDQISKMLRAQHHMKQQLGRDPKVEELADFLDVTTNKVEYMMQVARRPLSLQLPVGEEEDEVLGDFIEDDDAPPPDETAAQNLLREQLKKVLEKLPPREARILQLRYGLIDGRMLTLNEVGRKMGVTRERVRQIETQALHRLRNTNIQRDFPS